MPIPGGLALPPTPIQLWPGDPWLQALPPCLRSAPPGTTVLPPPWPTSGNPYPSASLTRQGPRIVPPKRPFFWPTSRPLPTPVTASPPAPVPKWPAATGTEPPPDGQTETTAPAPSRPLAAGSHPPPHPPPQRQQLHAGAVVLTPVLTGRVTIDAGDYDQMRRAVLAARQELNLVSLILDNAQVNAATTPNEPPRRQRQPLAGRRRSRSPRRPFAWYPREVPEVP